MMPTINSTIGPRKGFLAALFLIGLVLAVTIGSLSAQLFHQLARHTEAPRDNVQWSIFQIQSELNELRVRANKITRKDHEAISDFTTRFEIFYSRVALLETAPLFEALRGEAFFRDGIKNLRKLLVDLAPIMEAGGDRVFEARDVIRDRLAAEARIMRPFIALSIGHFAEVSDKERRDLGDLLRSVGLLISCLVVLLVVSVVSQRRHASVLQRQTQELLESRERLAATAGAALDGVIVADENGRILEFNEQASQCFGYARDDAIGRELADLIVPPRMREMHKTGMKRFVETGKAKIVGQRIEIDALHADGHEFPVELAVGSARRRDGRIFVAYVRDISERRNNERDLHEAREKAEGADEAKSRFLAVMSHEMRTPLNGITGVLQLLRDTPLETEQRALIDTADRAGEVLLHLINDVLDISKMEAGKLHLNTADFAPRDLLGRIVEIMNTVVETRNNAITLHIDETVPERLHGDDKRLTQILLNLTSNANKFTKSGTIDVGMRLVGIDDQTASLEFSVTDTGIGIPDDMIGELFSEFTSLENSYNRRQGGTGLGLSICKNLLELMGGRIHVASKLGVGSRFWFEVSLPVATSPDAPADDDGVLDAPVPIAPGTRVLLAEDNPTNAMVARTMLARAGCEVEHVLNGEEAFAVARAHPFDIILMDISMPGMDGIQATRLIRKLPTAIASVPVVAMTAHSLAADRERFLAAGMDDCITKPIRKNLLLQAIARHLAPSPDNTSHEASTEPATDEVPPAAVFDEDEIARLSKDVGAELLPELMAQFATDIEARAKAVHDGITAQDLGAARKAAHAIKGSAATIGAVRLSASAAHLERSCAAADWARIYGAMPAFAAIQSATVAYARNFNS